MPWLLTGACGPGHRDGGPVSVGSAVAGKVQRPSPRASTARLAARIQRSLVVRPHHARYCLIARLTVVSCSMLVQSMVARVGSMGEVSLASPTAVGGCSAATVDARDAAPASRNTCYGPSTTPRRCIHTAPTTRRQQHPVHRSGGRLLSATSCCAFPSPRAAPQTQARA